MLHNFSYGGPERRRHKMFVTKNTEYHFRDRVCVAVRDRRSGTWLPAHLALCRRLGGAVRFQPNGFPIPATGEPGIGEALFFDDDGRDLVTSPRLWSRSIPNRRASCSRTERDLVQPVGSRCAPCAAHYAARCESRFAYDRPATTIKRAFFEFRS
jgi:hypothetical protein